MGLSMNVDGRAYASYVDCWTSKYEPLLKLFGMHGDPHIHELESISTYNSCKSIGILDAKDYALRRSYGASELLLFCCKEPAVISPGKKG